MKWFALLGREKKLVEAELSCVAEPQLLEFSHSMAMGDGASPSWDQMGGVIRAGKIAQEKLGRQDLIESAVDSLMRPPESGKIHIGLSSTHLSVSELRQIGREIKEHYVARYNKRPRIIFPQKGSILNAGHIKGGRLLEHPNYELFFIQSQGDWKIAKTTWQQDIASYTRRDRERPVRDDKVGMLPPKLAQIMLNLAEVTTKSHVHDPFCGTGVILTEAILKNTTISGSDISNKMVLASQKNVAWISKSSALPPRDHQIFQSDARTVNIPATTTHIVSEGYLGSHTLRDQPHAKLASEAEKLQPLYYDFFQNISQFQSPLTIVLALPIWFNSNSSASIHLAILDDLPDMGYTVQRFAPGYSRTLIYRRPHQTVGREIIKLKKG